VYHKHFTLFGMSIAIKKIDILVTINVSLDIKEYTQEKILNVLEFSAIFRYGSQAPHGV
jgi:hypothetical protein